MLAHTDVKVTQDNIWLCQDCLVAAVNDDYTGLDYSYSPKVDDQKAKEIREGLDKLGSHLVPDFDSDTEDGIDEFSRKTCDCCGTWLAGSRHRFAILG